MEGDGFSIFFGALLVAILANTLGSNLFTLFAFIASLIGIAAWVYARP